MRSKTAMTCAAGAMLFGGTLGVAQEAGAGIAWTQVGAFAYAYGVGTPGFVGKSLSNYLSTQTASNAGYSSVGLGAFSSAGFAMSAQTASGGSFDVTCNHSFTVTGSVTVAISGVGFAGEANGFQLWNGSGAIWSSTDVVGAFSSGELVLQAGTYNLFGGVFSDAVTGGQATVLDFNVVPAPGAIALLGAAGIVTRRRRSN